MTFLRFLKQLWLDPESDEEKEDFDEWARTW